MHHLRGRIAGLLVVFSFAGVRFAWGQGQTIVPDSSAEHREDIGKRAHTNHLIFVRPDLTGSSPAGEIPASLGCVYQVTSLLTGGCPIKYDNSMPNPSGGSETIAIVDAYDYPSAYTDLTAFSRQFGLPQLPQCSSTITTSCFQKVYATTKPRTNCGWSQEAALDIEWAHAMSPNAKIVLVEAASNSNTNLFQAVDVATNEVICGNTTCPSGGTGTGEVSMSWGSSEFSAETSYDSHFASTQVVYFAASGDSGGKTIYPGTSPYVVAAGGTTINRDQNHNFLSETAWSGSGGGPSKYESRPLYQNVIVDIVGSQRGVPDFSFDANPNTGVSVYDSTPCQGLSGWLVFGGTSVASPSLAGIVNLASHFYMGSDSELSTIYSNLGSSNFRDITSGSAGGFTATGGWDFVTGVGSNLGFTGK